MPTGGNHRDFAVDTSVAVAALDPMHEAHAVCRAAAMRHAPALVGHAAFETFSVLTRLPGAGRVDPEVAADVIHRAFPDRCWLPAPAQDDLFLRLGLVPLIGGMVYDALVGEAARVSNRVLLTRDRRAVRTYNAIGVEVEFVAD